MNLLKRLAIWLEDRTGLVAALKPPATHPVPKNEGWSWYYVLGSATLVSFIVQVVTGTLLSLSYIPSTSQAYQTLQFITHDAVFGKILRGMHFFGASAMVLLIGLHTIRTFLMAAYKFPREMSWLSGVFLLFLTLAMGFTGQLLRWDQNAVWSVVVGVEQAARVPLIGKQIAHFVLGGDVLGGATLSRFYSTHVFFLPGIMYGLIALHLFLVVRNGISDRPRRGKHVDPATYREQYQNLLKVEGEPFWPNALWKDILFASLVVLTIFGLAATFGPPVLGLPPDPTLINAQPRPDWYLLWYFAVLSLLPKSTENIVIVYGPLFFAVVMLALPFISNRGARHPAERPWAVVIVLAAITIISSFTVAGYRSRWSPDFHPKPIPASVTASSNPKIREGAVLFSKKSCINCHQIAGNGGFRGPDLSLVGERLTHDQLVIRIVNGGTNMPPYGPTLKPDEFSSIVDFLESRKRP